LNYKLEDLVGIELIEFLLGTSRFDDIWTRSSCLHLDDKSLMKKNMEFKFGVSRLAPNLNSLNLLRILLTNGFDA
jgi:hypothetical protein